MSSRATFLPWDNTVWEADSVIHACVAALGHTATFDDDEAVVRRLGREFSAEFDIRGLKVRLLDISCIENLHARLVQERPSLAAVFAHKTLIRLPGLSPFPLSRRAMESAHSAAARRMRSAAEYPPKCYFAWEVVVSFFGSVETDITDLAWILTWPSAPPELMGGFYCPIANVALLHAAVPDYDRRAPQEPLPALRCAVVKDEASGTFMPALSLGADPALAELPSLVNFPIPPLPATLDSSKFGFGAVEHGLPPRSTMWLYADVESVLDSSTIDRRIAEVVLASVQPHEFQLFFRPLRAFTDKQMQELQAKLETLARSAQPHTASLDVPDLLRIPPTPFNSDMLQDAETLSRMAMPSPGFYDAETQWSRTILASHYGLIKPNDSDHTLAERVLPMRCTLATAALLRTALTARGDPVPEHLFPDMKHCIPKSSPTPARARTPVHVHYKTLTAASGVPRSFSAPSTTAHSAASHGDVLVSTREPPAASSLGKSLSSSTPGLHTTYSPPAPAHTSQAPPAAGAQYSASEVLKTLTVHKPVASPSSRPGTQANHHSGAPGVDGLRGPPGPENKSLVLRRDSRTAEGVPLDRVIVIKHLIVYLAKKTDGKGLWMNLLADHGLELLTTKAEAGRFDYIFLEKLPVILHVKRERGEIVVNNPPVEACQQMLSTLTSENPSYRIPVKPAGPTGTHTELPEDFPTLASDGGIAGTLYAPWVVNDILALYACHLFSSAAARATAGLPVCGHPLRCMKVGRYEGARLGLFLWRDVALVVFKEAKSISHDELEHSGPSGLPQTRYRETCPGVPVIGDDAFISHSFCSRVPSNEYRFTIVDFGNVLAQLCAPFLIQSSGLHLRRVVLTGHGMGAAFATLALALAMRGGLCAFLERGSLITFGSPRIGNVVLSEAVQSGAEALKMIIRRYVVMTVAPASHPSALANPGKTVFMPDPLTELPRSRPSMGNNNWGHVGKRIIVNGGNLAPSESSQLSVYANLLIDFFCEQQSVVSNHALVAELKALHKPFT